MFDELEIAPKGIQKQLIEATRSSNQKFFFKLALSPYNENAITPSVTSSPSAGNDFDQLQLWYARKDQKGASDLKRKFCLDLWRSMLLQRGAQFANPRQIFGEGFFDVDEDDTVSRLSGANKKKINPYSPEGKWGIRFIRLYENDPSFKRYLDCRRIDPHKLVELDPSMRDKWIRKITQIVAVRDFFRKRQDSETDEVSERSRKSISIYTGADALFDISEGHPRWFKVTVGRLLDQSAGSVSMRVNSTLQAAEILAAAQRFSALLRTFPVDSTGMKKGYRGLLSLVSTISTFFRDKIVKGPFSADPYLSFTVDSNISEGLLRSLEQALNLGAIVYVPDGDGEVLLTSLRGKRFRISYWLAPLYGLPLTLGRSISLSNILDDGQGKSGFGKSESLGLPFDDKDHSL